MRRMIVLVTLSAAIVVVAFFVWKRSSRQAARPLAEVSDARGPACEVFVRQQGENGSCGTLILQLLPSSKEDLPEVKLNAIGLRWDQTEVLLTDVLKTRPAGGRVVFLSNETAVSPAHKALMIDVVRRAGAERVCVLDPKNPPTWYPPQSCGAAGDGLRTAAH